MNITEAQINDITNIAFTFPQAPVEEIRRDSLIQTIDDTFKEGANVVIVEGGDGIGKTTLLMQFVNDHRFNSVCYFISPQDRYTYSPLAFNYDLYQQFYFLIKQEQLPESEENNQLSSIRADLDRFLRKNKDRKIFIILDGLDQIQLADLNVLSNVISDLRWGKKEQVHFLISGKGEIVRTIIPSVGNITIGSVRVTSLSYNETESYLSDLALDPPNIEEIHRSVQGNISKLASVKRSLRSFKGDIEDFFKELSKSEIFELEWNKIDETNELQINILTILAFDDNKFTLDELSRIFKVNTIQINNSLKNITFISFENEAVAYISESFRRFAKTKLKTEEKRILDLIIDY